MKTQNIFAAAAGLALGYFVFRKNDAAIGFSNSNVRTHKTGDGLTTYKCITVADGKKEWSVCMAYGEFNYINITDTKMMRVWGTTGKEFRNFDDAVQHYKSPNMKAMLLWAESVLMDSKLQES